MNPTLAQNDSILKALEEQVQCYRHLAKLAQVQHEQVRNHQTEALLVVLSKRQEVLNQIATLEDSLRPAKGRWADFLAEIDADRRQRAEAFLAESRRLLEAITVSDRNDAIVLQNRKMNLGKSISQARSAKQVNRNYAKSAYGKAPSRMDIHS